MHALVKLFRKAKQAKGQSFAVRVAQRFYQARYAAKDIPIVEKYAKDPDFEKKHPRGQPENAGEFAEVHATIGDRPGEGVHMKLRHGSVIQGPQTQTQTTDPPQDQGHSAEQLSSFGSDVKLADEPEKQLWQKNLREAIPESQINESLPFAEHMQAVQDAIQRGEDVPQDVLDDYPELRDELDASREPSSTPRTPEELASIESAISSNDIDNAKFAEPDSSANEVCFVTFSDGHRGVFKPTAGEYQNGREDVPNGTLSMREIAAYEVAKIIGMDDLVPVTVAHDGVNEGESGSMQEFCENANVAREIHGAKAYDGKRDASRAIVFDFIMGNSDRHSKNWMIDDGGKLRLIDNGFCLPEKHGLQTLAHMGPRKNQLAVRYQNLPLDEAKAAWADDETMESVYEKLSKLGISKEALQRMDERRDIIMAAPNWKTAIDELFKRNMESA